MLTRRGYERAGGHAAVRGEVLEDIALLRAVKRAGGRGVPIDGSRLAACRMYDGWPAVRDGYAKSLWASVGGSPRAGVAAAALLTAVWVLPPVAALRGSRAGLLGYAAGVAGRAAVVARGPAGGPGRTPWPIRSRCWSSTPYGPVGAGPAARHPDLARPTRQRLGVAPVSARMGR